MRTRPSQTPLPSIYEQASQRANTPNQAPGTAQNDGLAHLEFALGKHGSTFLGIGIDFQSNRQDRLIDIIVMATLDGINLRGGMPSALLEIEGGKAVLARRLNGAPPFAPLRASITPADFCRIVRGQKLAIAFERPADGAEAAIDARLAPTSVEISGPAAKAICT